MMKPQKLLLVPLVYAALFFALSQHAVAEHLYIVHFETGPAWQKELAPGDQQGFGEHAANLQSLRKSGVIKFGARYEHLGMIVIAEESLDSATKLIEGDPGVKSGLFNYDIAQMNVFYPWQENQLLLQKP